MTDNPIVAFGASCAHWSALLQEIRDRFAPTVDWWSIHGVNHWGRVYENGMRIADATGADRAVIAYFAVLHDSARVHDGHDEGHGARGADRARELRHLIDLDDEQFALLCDACKRHSDGETDAHPTVQACWDADRLDLARVGITPIASKLCTVEAEDLIEWASERARSGTLPAIVKGWTVQHVGYVRSTVNAAVKAGLNSLVDEFAGMLRGAEYALSELRRGDPSQARIYKRMMMADGILMDLARVNDAIGFERHVEIFEEIVKANLSDRTPNMIAEPVLALRVCGPDMRSIVDRSFVWPERGIAECSDYQPTPLDDERGLYAIEWEAGQTEPHIEHLAFRNWQPKRAGMVVSDTSLGRWLVLRVSEGVRINHELQGGARHGRWIKFPRCEVLHVGAGAGADSFDDAVRFLRTA